MTVDLASLSRIPGGLVTGDVLPIIRLTPTPLLGSATIPDLLTGYPTMTDINNSFAQLLTTYIPIWFSSLPTTPPAHVAGKTLPWNNSGVLSFV